MTRGFHGPYARLMRSVVGPKDGASPGTDAFSTPDSWTGRTEGMCVIYGRPRAGVESAVGPKRVTILTYRHGEHPCKVVSDLIVRG